MSNLFAFGDKVIGGGESSQSDGHIIQDSSGTAMTAQPNLQFADANVENDNTNNATVVRNFVDIDWDDWQEVDDNDDTYYRVTDAPLVDGNVEVDLMKKLWENPDPTASFAAQDITLSSDDYDYLFIDVKYATTLGYDSSNIIPKNQNAYLIAPYTGPAQGPVIARRDITFTDSTHIGISNCELAVGGAGSVNNTACVPVAIYGIKQKVSISLSAIISNISTSAENCMMPDGETSVAEKIEANKAGARTRINSYTSSNVFVIPSDGYIEVNANSSTSDNGIVQLRGSDDSIVGWISANYPNIGLTYVKKNMKAFTQLEAAQVAINFIPLM